MSDLDKGDRRDVRQRRILKEVGRGMTSESVEAEGRQVTADLRPKAGQPVLTRGRWIEAEGLAPVLAALGLLKQIGIGVIQAEREERIPLG